MTICQTTPAKIRELWSRSEERIRSAESVQEVAQALIEQIHDEFTDSLALVRLFMSVPYQFLPEMQRRSARDLARSAGLLSLLTPTTPVHSLLATRGALTDWNEVGRSRGHIAIPLLSEEFVGSIPMMAKLLKELMLPLTWVQDPRGLMLRQTIGSEAGYFYVGDAATARDDQARLIIPAQDFVSDQGVKSVFAVGGVVSGGAALVIIFFCRELVEVRTIRTFIPLVNLLKAALISRSSTSDVFSHNGSLATTSPEPIST